MHMIWTFCNQQIQSHLLETQVQDITTAIHHEFNLGHQDLLPEDQFCIATTPDLGSHTLQSILNLPLEDQQLWIHATQQAWAHGS